MTSRSRMVFLLLVGLAIQPAGTAAQPGDDDSKAGLHYRELVDAYRAGDHGSSVDGVLAFSERVLTTLVNRYVALGRTGFSDATSDRGFFRGASMLHTDAAFRCLEQDEDQTCLSHLHLARRLVDVSEHPGSKEGFRRRWYAATALVLTLHLVPAEALEYFEQAIKELPDDVALLTAAGWFSERRAGDPAQPGLSLRNGQASQRRHLRSATRFLTRALDADPRAAEASLRLARVELASGDVAAARDRLTALLARDDLEPLVAYVGRVSLGDLRERDGDVRAAERLYREAITLNPLARSARLALAKLLYASGNAAAAAEVIEPAVRSDTEGDRNDPWSAYQHAYPAVGRLVLDELREAVQR